MAMFISTAAQTSFSALSKGISLVFELNLTDSIKTKTEVMQVLKIISFYVIEYFRDTHNIPNVNKPMTAIFCP